MLDRYIAGELCDQDKEEVARMASQNAALQQLLHSMSSVGHRWSSGPWAVNDGWKAMTLRMATLRSRPVARLVSSEPASDAVAGENTGLPLPSHRGYRYSTSAAYSFSSLLNGWARQSIAVIIAGALAVIGILSFNSFGERRIEPDTAMNELTTTASQRTTIRLVDGTWVTLGPKTKLRIPSNFGKVRDVYLQGEAMFEVESSSTNPFVVHTSHTSVRVLGTVFNVRAHENLNRVEVAVVSGRVSLTAPHNNASATLVSADYVGTMYPNGEARVDRVSLEPYTEWVNNRLIYRNTPLREVVADLARWYDVQVIFDRISTDQRRLIADWDPRSITHVLRSLSLVLDARYEYRDGQIIFSPREELRENAH